MANGASDTIVSAGHAQQQQLGAAARQRSASKPLKRVRCPHCNSMRIRVVTTMHTEEGDWVRRRRCLVCGHRWYTLQPPETEIAKELLKLPRWWVGANLVEVSPPYPAGSAAAADGRKRTG